MHPLPYAVYHAIPRNIHLEFPLTVSIVPIDRFPMKQLVPNDTDWYKLNHILDQMQIDKIWCVSIRFYVDRPIAIFAHKLRAEILCVLLPIKVSMRRRTKLFIFHFICLPRLHLFQAWCARFTFWLCAIITFTYLQSAIQCTLNGHTFCGICAVGCNCRN